MPVVITTPTEPAPNNPVSANSTGANAVAGVIGSAVTSFVQVIDPTGQKGFGPGFPTNPNGIGVLGMGHTGVQGESDTGPGVLGTSQQAEGVRGQTTSATSAAVAGFSTGGYEGVHGETTATNGSAAVGAINNGTGPAFYGISQQAEGVRGQTGSATAAAVSGINTGTGPAGFFQGNVVVTGDVQLTGADCAEQFDAAQAAWLEPGTVVVIDERGALAECGEAYDRKVAGVVSGAGECRPGVILDAGPSRKGRVPVALVGKAYCKVDAGLAPIEVGDLLTTSGTPGHAMKATDANKAFGAVIGKALRPQRQGQGLIPILIALQ